MIEQIPQFVKGFLVGLPIWGVLGWFINRILGPSVDELGIRIKKWTLGQFSRDEYSTYVAYTKLERTLSELHKSQGHSRFSYKNNHDVNLIIKKYNAKQLRDITRTWIEHGHIWSYAEGDIFFAGMELLMQYLTKENLDEVVRKHKENNQANVWPFLEKVEEERPELLSASILSYLRDEQRKYEAKRAGSRQKDE